MAHAQQALLIGVVTELADTTTMTTRKACLLVGIAASTFYRITRNYHHYHRVADPMPHVDRVQPTSLTEQERTTALDVLGTDEYSELSVVQTYWRAFDAGLIVCSQRTFYRIARRAGLVGDRREVRGGQSHPRSAPIVAATKPGDLWSWDVTDLRGPRKQDRYKLYLVIDVFSRYPIAWRIETHENKTKAVEMFARAFAEHGSPDTVHSDNGAIMRAAVLVEELDKAGALASYSRPRVSDDNPFSESLFKTIKYDLSCPPNFESIDHARKWTAAFLHRYATEHRHSGLGFYTPHQVHTGTAEQVRIERQQHLDQYYAQHPERFRARPTAPALPQPTGINLKLSQTG